MMGALAHPFKGEELPLEPQLLLLDWSLLPEYAVTQGPPGAGGGAFPGGPSKAVTWHVYKTHQFLICGSEDRPSELHAN